MKPMTAEQAGLPETRKGLLINEMFWSPQGEGANAGLMMVFVRLSKCNLRCTVLNSAGFDCDTDFEGGVWMTLDDVHQRALSLCGQSTPDGRWLLLTGGEPGLQLTHEFVTGLKSYGWRLAIETNGTVKLPDGIDWICVSPKTAEHTIRQRVCNELKVVRGHGQSIGDWSSIKAEHRFVSPCFGPGGTLHPKDAQWCLDLIKQNDQWRLSLQTHKFLGVR